MTPSTGAKRPRLGGSLVLLAILIGAISWPAQASVSSITAVGAGGGFSCGLRSSGGVACWGNDIQGEVGDGTTGGANHYRLKPRSVKTASGNLASVTSISVGDLHTCVVTSSTDAWCWGANPFGQIGDGTTGGSHGRQTVATRVKRGDGGFLTGVKAVSAGGEHSCALLTNGSVWCWGMDDYGQLGDGTTGDAGHHRLTAVEVKDGSGYLANVTSIETGGHHTCAVTTDHTARCWGADYAGQLGDGTTGGASKSRLEPVEVMSGSAPLTDVKIISAGDDHTCVVKTDATAACWGGGFYGQIGDGTRGNTQFIRLRPQPVRQGSGYLTGVTAISAGTYATCAVRTDHSGWCWGQDDWGQLGDGTTGNAQHRRLEPVRVISKTGPLGQLKAISMGDLHACGLQTTGIPWCWGDDHQGADGDDTTGGTHHQRLKAVKVLNL